MPVIGLTGNIASGKSLVSKTLQELGARIVDADKIAREVVLPGSDGHRRIVDVFGTSILKPDGTIDRKLLGAQVFASRVKMDKLNAVTHPLILARIADQVREFRAGPDSVRRILVVDAPLLIETGLQKVVDEVWVVDVPEQTQISRLMARDRISSEQAMEKIRAQMPAAEKRSCANLVIDNSGNITVTREKVKNIWVQRFGKSGVEGVDH